MQRPRKEAFPIKQKTRIVPALACVLALLLSACAAAGSSGARAEKAAEAPMPESAGPAAPQQEERDAPPVSGPEPGEAAPQEEAGQEPPELPGPEAPANHHAGNSAAHAQTCTYGSVPGMEENYELAAELGNRYGIFFRIADLIPDRMPEEGDAYQNDPVLVGAALRKIDSILSAYPEHYFDQLVFGDHDRLELVLVGFCPVGMGYVAACPEYAGEADGRLVLELCLDIENSGLIDELDYNLPHELAHLTDWYLQYLSDTEEGHLFSEEAWNALNPEGFEYSYGDEDMELAAYDAAFEYFSYSYGCCNPLEDRATLFGFLMQNHFRGTVSALTPQQYAKLEFYSRCIRDAFGDWPEAAAWETQLAACGPEAGSPG